MNVDFRISVSLPTHPKAIKLMRRCGDIAFYNLVRLWAFVAQNRPDGDLTGLTDEDIEIACGWSGQCSELYRALLELKFIKIEHGKQVVNDWHEYNGYACYAKKRSARAKKAAEARWSKHTEIKKDNANSNAQAMQNDACSNAPSPAPAPTPAPAPPPKGGGVGGGSVAGPILKIYPYPDWLDKKLWGDFHRMRSRIKKPITTELTITRLLSALEKLINNGHSQTEIIQNAIDHCWQSFYPPKQKRDDDREWIA